MLNDIRHETEHFEKQFFIKPTLFLKTIALKLSGFIHSFKQTPTAQGLPVSSVVFHCIKKLPVHIRVHNSEQKSKAR